MSHFSAGFANQKFRNDLKFLNSLLKLNDIICSKINTISDPTDLLLIYYAINFELEYIKELIKKKL